MVRCSPRLCFWDSRGQRLRQLSRQRRLQGYPHPERPPTNGYTGNKCKSHPIQTKSAQNKFVQLPSCQKRQSKLSFFYNFGGFLYITVYYLDTLYWDHCTNCIKNKNIFFRLVNGHVYHQETLRIKSQLQKNIINRQLSSRLQGAVGGELC